MTVPPLSGTLAGYRRPFAALPDDLPTLSDVRRAMPPECFWRSAMRSFVYAIGSVSLTVGCAVLACYVLPAPSFSPLSILAWLAYAVVNGTIATGVWVVAHECGHGAFSNQEWLCDTVGFVLHSALLVPYFSWKRSHALHHSRTNHMTLGETHVPPYRRTGFAYERLYNWIGHDAFAVFNLVTHLLIGWPMYLLFGATGSPARGKSNHFVPTNDKVFPGRSWKVKVLLSDVGVVSALAMIALFSTSAAWALGVYGGPYLVVNAWLVLYTWMHHTDVDVPHFSDEHWTWMKGALCTVDRPYPALIDFLHHHIGSTHVVHHIDYRIPHYSAKAATNAFVRKWPHLYKYDPTPVWRATWRVAGHCVRVIPIGKAWFYTSPAAKPAASQLEG
ncbi:Fatty acid desaturase domain-containing protein [Plasmodiophora brassicae]